MNQLEQTNMIEFFHFKNALEKKKETKTINHTKILMTKYEKKKKMKRVQKKKTYMNKKKEE
jgi:hypothetical protein